MPRRHDHLFDQIASFQALTLAARQAVRGKRHKPGAAAFMARLEHEVLRLERELLSGSYRTGQYLELVVRDPKRRVVSAAPFRDRVVHHALVAVIGPIFDRGFIDRSFANRQGKGTHRAVQCFERLRDARPWVLRGDVWRFFPSIDHAVLKADLSRRIACQRTLDLCATIIDGSNAQEPVLRYFPGDDLFTPHERRRGLPLGNLTSQFFANVHLDALDHFACEVLQAPYLRYADDFALFARSQLQASQWRSRIETWLAGRRLALHPDKTRVLSCDEPQQFLGFELLPGGRRRLHADNVSRFRARLDALRAGWRAGRVDDTEVQTRVQGWIAHARHADTAQLRHTLFRGGWFDPRWSDGRPVKAS